MTTSVRNNSVFRSFFEKQKLTGPKFIDWYRQLLLVLSIKDKENYLEHPIPAAPVAPPGQQPTQSPSSGSSSSSDASSSDSPPPRFRDLKDVYDSCIATQIIILEQQKEYSITLLEQRFLVFGTPMFQISITWSSKKQEMFAFSSSKVEYAAVTSIARQVLWLRTLLVDFNCEQKGAT
nr:zinc finger, CCHC-type [Tanacetum cinerariifolium]